MFTVRKCFPVLTLALALALTACSIGSAQPTGTAGANSPTVTAPASPSPSPTDAQPTDTAVPATEAPTPTPTPDAYLAKVALKDPTTWLNVRAKPDAKAVVVGCIPEGGELAVKEQGEEWDKIVFEDGFAYVASSFVQIERPLAPGEQPPALQLMYAAPKATSGIYTPAPSPSGTGPATTAAILKDNLVDVRKYCPNAVFYMIFATEDNFMGKPLYPKKLCLLQKAVAERLKKAEDLFEADGYRIKIYDAYRPISVSNILDKKIKNGRFIAAPGKSSHNRGCAVDITLVDSNGVELEMQSKVHDLSENAYVNNPKASADAKKNWNYMWGILKKCGFESYQYEWWHFSDPNVGKYLPTDYDFMKIPMVK
jgi:D-alanyl-D-alanine dipeptidase